MKEKRFLGTSLKSNRQENESKNSSQQEVEMENNNSEESDKAVKSNDIERAKDLLQCRGFVKFPKLR